jgi:2-methylisocitrate lyase-like PEP mutase family enzyme
MPDMGFLNLHDIVDVSRRIAAAVDTPVIVDADTGFGNSMNMLRTVGEFERAGVAGIIFEDQIEYKKCRMIETKHPVVPTEEHAAKIRAASLTKREPDFFIIARTDAASDHGVKEAVNRAHLYTEAGADMLDIEILGTPDELASIKAANFSLPLTANMDEGKRLWKYDLTTLQDAGYRIAAYPGVVRYTVVRSVMESLDHLKREGSTAKIIHKMSTVKEWFDAVDLDRFLEMEKDLLQPFLGRKGAHYDHDHRG